MDVPLSVRTAVLEVVDAETMELPGAKMSTHGP
jgi:hypothetical protein